MNAGDAGAEIEQAIVRGLAFLREHGYVVDACRSSTSEASGRIVHVSCTSESARRTVSVTYYPDRPSVQAALRHVDDEFAFADAGVKYFREPRWQDVPGHGLARLAAYLAALRGELEGPQSALLHGAAFRNDAFDWSPYK